MRISWLSSEEIAAARAALTRGGASYDDLLAHAFTSPPAPAGWAMGDADWAAVTEHVARAERVSRVVRDDGLAAARARFAGSGAAIEVATLAAAAHQSDELTLDDVLGVLACPIDPHLFYAELLALLVELGKGALDRTVAAYEQFVAAYAAALSVVPHGGERIGAARDGLADFYVRAGRLVDADALFARRHDEDLRDVAVALSASRAFLAAGSISHAVRWLGMGAARARQLGRGELASRLAAKQDRVRARLS